MLDGRTLDELRDDIEDDFYRVGELWSDVLACARGTELESEVLSELEDWSYGRETSDLFTYPEDVDELDGYDEDWWD